MKTTPTPQNGKATTPTSKAITNLNTSGKKLDDIIKAAHDQAEKDIEEDPDFKSNPKTHDLDEGEIARLGDE